MKTVNALAIALILLCGSCLSIQKGTPACVRKKIRQYDHENQCDRNVHVAAYTFQGKNVYVFEPGTCGADMTSEVIDSDCNQLGYLGGFIGNTKINGESFENAVFIDTIWKKH